MNTTDMNTQETLENGYQTLLLGYAAGNLDEAQNLIVATHLTFSERARQFVEDCEAMGGALIETQCEPVAMQAEALNNVLDKLDAFTEHSGNTLEENLITPVDFDIPTPLKSSLRGDKHRKAQWNMLFPGMKAFDINLDCKESVARFMKADPGLKSPHHSHNGMEITLVLDGAFSDETGAYKRGDMIVTDDTCHHTPIACETRGCTCLVVTSAPVKLHGIASVLNPFLKR
ncbi:MAG: ChrR family anti-sigma-E factor [Pseudomonadota bacterium]